MTTSISTTRRQFLGLAMGAGASTLLSQEPSGPPPAESADDDKEFTGEGMKALLFFDDWLLHRREGLDRHWHQPTFVKALFSDFYPGFLGYGGYMTVFYDQRVGRYVMYFAVYPPRADPATFVVRLESDDPRNWPNPRYRLGLSPAWKGFENVVVDQHGERFWPYAVQSLAGSPLAEKGYVTTNWYRSPQYEEYVRRLRAEGRLAGSRRPNGVIGGSVLGFSQDGLHFDVDRKHPWRPVGADQSGNVLWSDKLGKFVIFTRRADTDRRIVYSTTEDFRQFSPLLTALQPDALDLIGTEFYDLPARPYEDFYLGFLHVQRTDPNERARIMTTGSMQTQLAHSYNGINWVRPVREPFFPVQDYGQPCGGALYGMEILRTSDDRLLLYATGSYGEHDAYPAMQAAGMDTTGYFSPLLFEMRLDGFCSLRTRSRDGLLETKTIVPQAGGIRLNLRTTKHTEVRVQLLDGMTLKPLAGYTFEQAVGISGDHLFAPVRWKEHPDISEWIGKPIGLQIQMREAELFAIRMTYKSYYSQIGTPPFASMA